MTNEEIYNEEEKFIVYLTVDGTGYDTVVIEITDPNRSIRETIALMVNKLNLPKVDGGGNPLQYMLALESDNDDEPITLEYEDEDGREQTPSDYNIQPGDYLHLTSIPIAG